MCGPAAGRAVPLHGHDRATARRISPAQVAVQPDGRCTVVTDTLQRAVTPGQSAVIYLGDDAWAVE